MATFNKTLSGTDYIVTSGEVLSSTYGLGYFGDGTDGDAIITGSFTAGRELYYNNLSITGTGSFKPNGYKLYVKETLTIETSASINDDGNIPVGTTGGLLINTRNYLGGAAGGGANSIINAAAGGLNGGGSGGNSSLNVSNLAPTGGAGGTAGVRAGGNGGGAAQQVQIKNGTVDGMMVDFLVVPSMEVLEVVLEDVQPLILHLLLVLVVEVVV